MQISQAQLARAVEQGILSHTQAQRLIIFLSAHPVTNAQSDTIAKFDFTHILYYVGGLLAIGAMSVFMTLGWESFGGQGIIGLSVLYAVVGIMLTNRMADQGLNVVAGICAAFVVCLVPLAVFGLQHALGVWPSDDNYRDYHRHIQWHWLYMELATLAVAVVLAKIYRYPFLVMPIALALWYLSMDLAVMLTGDYPEFELRALVSMYIGLFILGLAFWIDIRSRHTVDYAFWLYIFGTVAFWCGLSMQHSEEHMSKFIYFCINLLMVGIGAILVRRVLVVFGAFGVCGYLGYLAYDVFNDSWLFPIVLTLLGGIIVYLGILWQKHEHRLSQTMLGYLPLALRELLQHRKS